MVSKVRLVARRGTSRRFRDERDGKVSQGFPRIENSLNDMHVYEVRPRTDKRGVESDFRCAAVWRLCLTGSR